jgi:hypothetical protein
MELPKTALFDSCVVLDRDLCSPEIQRTLAAEQHSRYKSHQQETPSIPQTKSNISADVNVVSLSGNQAKPLTPVTFRRLNSHHLNQTCCGSITAAMEH